MITYILIDRLTFREGIIYLSHLHSIDINHGGNFTINNDADNYRLLANIVRLSLKWPYRYITLKYSAGNLKIFKIRNGIISIHNRQIIPDEHIFDYLVSERNMILSGGCRS